MTLKQELQEKVISFQKERIEKMEKEIKKSAKDGYNYHRFSKRFYDESVVEYFKNKGLEVELKYGWEANDKLEWIILKW